MEKCDKHGWQETICEECAIQQDVAERERLRAQIRTLREALKELLRNPRSRRVAIASAALAATAPEQKPPRHPPGWNETDRGEGT